MKTSLPAALAMLVASTAISSALDFVTATVAPGATPVSGWTGIVGTRFAVQASEIPAGAQVKVTHLGFYAGVAGQFTGAGAVDVAHNVTLNGPQFYPGRQGDYSGLPVASVAVPIGNPVDGNGWSWVALPTPVILQGGTYYVIAVDNVTNALDPYFDPDKGPGGSAVIVAPDVIFKNGAAGTDGFMQGRYGLAAGWEAYPASGYLGASFQYTLDTAPVISTDLPATTVVTAGGTTTLSVALSAGYPVNYLWEHDPLPTDDVWVTVGSSPSHTISPASAAETGNYRVTVSNTLGSDQSVGSVELDPDTDGDGLDDVVETNTGIYVSPTDTGTHANVVDTDQDGYWDGYEVTNASSPVNPDSPGGPNPAAIAVSFNNAFGEVTGYGLSPIMYAGASAVRQKNWNRTNPFGFPANGTQADVALPSSGVLVDSAGIATAMTMSFSSVGAWANNNEDLTPYGRLYGPFIYGDSVNPDVNVSLGNVPYAFYDVYVYMGATLNGFTGAVSSGSTTYSYSTGSNATSGGALGVDVYTETTAPTGSPLANYCVFRNVSGSTFSFKHTRGNINGGIFGFQVVQRTATPYQSWAISKGLDLNTNGAPGFDADFDGFDNLLEYGLFTEPASGSSLPVFVPVAAGGNLSLTYNRATAATDVTYTAQWSTNLVDWFPTGLTDAPTGNVTPGAVEHLVTVAQAGDPAKFLRVVVTQP